MRAQERVRKASRRRVALGWAARGSSRGARRVRAEDSGCPRRRTRRARAVRARGPWRCAQAVWWTVAGKCSRKCRTSSWGSRRAVGRRSPCWAQAAATQREPQPRAPGAPHRHRVAGRTRHVPERLHDEHRVEQQHEASHPLQNSVRLLELCVARGVPRGGALFVAENEAVVAGDICSCCIGSRGPKYGHDELKMVQISG